MAYRSRHGAGAPAGTCDGATRITPAAFTTTKAPSVTSASPPLPHIGAHIHRPLWADVDPAEAAQLEASFAPSNERVLELLHTHPGIQVLPVGLPSTTWEGFLEPKLLQPANASSAMLTRLTYDILSLRSALPWQSAQAGLVGAEVLALAAALSAGAVACCVCTLYATLRCWSCCSYRTTSGALKVLS